MNDWLHDLPLSWMALVVFGFTYVIAAAIYAAVSTMAVGKFAKSFKLVSPGMLSPLGVVFGLFVAFTAAQVWSDNDRAAASVSREASALRSVLVLSANFPDEAGTRLQNLVRDYVQEAATVEWPMMAHQTATLHTQPRPLIEALLLALSLPTTSSGQQAAQHEITNVIETALDARRQRIILSVAHVSLVKWVCVYLQAVCLLLAIAMVHSDDGAASLIAIGLFATGVASSALLIAAYDRPFVGQLAVSPEPLLQVVSTSVPHK
jgi:hypothetical protein